MVSVEKNLHFLSTGDQAKFPSSITEILINVLYILFWMHSDYSAVNKEQVPGHVFITFNLAQRLWGSRKESSSQDVIVISPSVGSSALEEHSFGD